MGGRFWLLTFASIIGACIAGFLFFTLMGKAWEQWGALGATILAMVLVIGVAWVFDRRAQRNYDA